MDQPIAQSSRVGSATLDHALEFVEVVRRQAPILYERLMKNQRMQGLLASHPAFNCGKLYAYAEFLAFRSEFQERFPSATEAACINAYCGLFLKNDISITRLLEFLEDQQAPGRRWLPGHSES